MWEPRGVMSGLRLGQTAGLSGCQEVFSSFSSHLLLIFQNVDRSETSNHPPLSNLSVTRWSSDWTSALGWSLLCFCPVYVNAISRVRLLPACFPPASRVFSLFFPSFPPPLFLLLRGCPAAVLLLIPPLRPPLWS